MCLQVFQRIECGSQLEEFDQRFQYFVEKVGCVLVCMLYCLMLSSPRLRHLHLQIIPEFSTPLMQGTAIFIQSYFDFVRIRNYLKKEDISFCQICELVDMVDSRRWIHMCNYEPLPHYLCLLHMAARVPPSVSPCAQQATWSLFCVLCLHRYTRTPDVKRARVWFYHRQRHFLIFTERFHFFHRQGLECETYILFSVF